MDLCLDYFNGIECHKINENSYHDSRTIFSIIRYTRIVMEMIINDLIMSFQRMGYISAHDSMVMLQLVIWKRSNFACIICYIILYKGFCFKHIYLGVFNAHLVNVFKGQTKRQQIYAWKLINY